MSADNNGPVDSVKTSTLCLLFSQTIFATGRKRQPIAWITSPDSADSGQQSSSVADRRVLLSDGKLWRSSCCPDQIPLNQCGFCMTSALLHIENTVCDEVNSFAHSLSAWPQQYDQVVPGHFHGRLQDVQLPSVRLFRETMNLSVAQHTRTPAGKISVLIPISLDGNKTSDQARCVASHGVTLLPYQNDFFFVGPANTDYIVISLDQQQLSTLLTEDDMSELLSAQRSYEVPVNTQRLTELQNQAETLLNQLLKLQSGTDDCHFTFPDSAELMQVEERKAIRRAALEQAIQHQLIDMTLDLFSPAQKSKPAMRPLGNHHHYLVRSCHEHVLSEQGADDSVLDICKALNVPRRTLNYSFERVAGCSPAQYLRAVKLNAARRELLSGDLPIGSVAANYGFYHGGYFGQEYRRLFGETPSDTRSGRRQRKL